MPRSEMLKLVERLERLVNQKSAAEHAPLEPIHEWLTENGLNEPAPGPGEKSAAYFARLSTAALRAMIDARREGSDANARR